MKKIIALLLSFAMTLSLVACGNGSSSSHNSDSSNSASSDSSYDNVTLKLSYATGDTGMDGIAAIEFERLVEEKSNGMVKIDRFPNCQLAGGDMSRHVEMMIAGGAFELAIISEGTFADVDRVFQVTSIPFAYNSYEDAYKWADSTGGEFSKQLYAKYGIVRLDCFSSGIMQFANNKVDVHTPDDLTNLKIRTFGELQMSLMRDMGADPTNMSWSELYSALQTGTVNGNVNGYQTLWSGSMHEVQPYITEVNAIWAQYVFMANQGAWDKLSPATQALLQECATEASLYARQYLNEVEEQIKQDMTDDYGVTIYVPTEEELKLFKEAAAPTINSYKEICGEDACQAWGIE